MKTVTFQYSLDGTSWSTAFALGALEIWCDLNPEYGDGAEKTRSDGFKCQKPTGYRFKVDVTLSWTNFNPETNASGALNWQFMQYWMCAPTRRIAYSGGSGHFGWDIFDASDNENYVNVLNWDYVYKSMEDENTGRKIRWITLELECRQNGVLALV